MSKPVSYDVNFILTSIITWINDVMITNGKARFRYIDNDVSGIRYREESRSYLLGKFILPGKMNGEEIESDNILYLSYLLDPNFAWGEPNKMVKLYAEIDAYILNECKKSLLNGLNIEILRDQTSNQQYHEKNSYCRTEETVRHLYEDTVGIWYPIMTDKVEADSPYSLIRDSGKYRSDKQRVYRETGKSDFSDYVAEVEAINSNYDFSDVNNIKLAFNEFKDVYYSYFGVYPFEENEPGTQSVAFRLLNWTDYSIKDKINNKRV